MKRVFVFVLTVVMALSLGSSVTYAVEPSIEQMVVSTNEKIYTEIAKAEDKGADLTENDDEEANNILDKLYDKTYKIDSRTIDEGTENGYNVERYWVDVTIGDQTKAIDPCRVTPVSD
jgi:hypothetical protein